MNCLKEDQQLVTGRDIFAWIDMNTTKEASLRFSLPLGIKHSDISLFMNQYNEKNYDQDFVNINGSPKRDPKFSLDLYYLYVRGLFGNLLGINHLKNRKIWKGTA